MQVIHIDISNKGVIPTIYAKQGDVGRKFLIVFTESGVPYQIADDELFSAWYDGDSGDGNYTDIGDRPAFLVNFNTVEVELIAQMLEIPGKGHISIVLSKEDGSQIGSWNIPYICEELPGFESEGAKAYYTAFSKLIESIKSRPENIVIDDTLTMPGQAADSATVGSHFDKVNNTSGIVWLGGFISANGTYTSDDSRKCTNFIPCGENETVIFIGETNHANISALTFYDANKAVLQTNTNLTTDIAAECTANSPVGTRFVRLSYCPAVSDVFLLRIDGKTLIESAFDTLSKKINEQNTPSGGSNIQLITWREEA